MAYQESLEDEELQEYKDALSVVKKTKGQVVYFKLKFFHDHVCYSYSQLSEWVDEFFAVQEAFQDEDDEQDSDTQQSNRLSDELVEELARKITTNEKYLSAKNFVQRSEITETLLRQEEMAKHLDGWLIRRRIDNIYETEIRPKQDEETRKKVLELRKNGMKKVEIASRLGISPAMVNKFYYTED